MYFGIDTLGQTQTAIRIARQFQVPTVWLDCESTGEYDAAVGPGQRVLELRACVAEVESAGLRAGIYTGRWWWPDKMGNTEAFSRLPLWHSEYGIGSAPAAPVKEVDYGGWGDVAIHQYTSQFWCCGRNRDANYVFTEDNMTEAQLLEKLEELGLIGPGVPTLKRLNEWATEESDAIEERFTQIESLIGTTVDGPHSHRVSVTLE